MMKSYLYRIAVALIVCGGIAVTESFAAYYHVHVQDLDAGQPLTPPVAVVHSAGYRLFEVGGTASAGLELLAEDGMTGALVAEAEASAAVKQVVVGGSAPTFASYKFLIEGQPGDLLSIVSMFARTNDNFVGISSLPLPGGSEPVVIDSQVYDSGTEVNTGMVADIPAYGNELIGPDENGTITVINQYTVVNDPGQGQWVFNWPPAAQIVITPLPNAIPYEITIDSLSEGQPLTPPLAVLHDAGVSVLTAGSSASPGLELLAEEGMNGALTDELIPQDGIWYAHTLGTGPGPMQSGTIVAAPGQTITVLSMFARTNDVITGIHDVELPASGSISFDTMAYDAGTEENTGMMAHIPFYGNAGGPDQNGTIAEIQQYSVVDDPAGPLNYNWPPAARLTITASQNQSHVDVWSLYE